MLKYTFYKEVLTIQVTVYSKDSCGQCLGVKMFLKSKGIEFEEKNTDRNPDFKSEVSELGFNSLPVIRIVENDNLVTEPFSGFDPDKLTKIFGKLG